MKESLNFAGLRQHISAQCNSARGTNDQRITGDRGRLEPARGELDGRRTELGGGQAGQRDPPAPVGRHRIDRHQDGHPKHHRRQPKGANASPLPTPIPSTVPGNRRRTANGRVCSNTSP